MNNKLVFIGKVIALLGAILLASCVFAIGVYNYRGYTRTHLFDIYSPDGVHALIVTRIGQYDGYTERDEVALIDAEGHRNAVFVINMSSETLSSDSFEIAWDADSVEICGKDSNFALRVSYEDVAGRNISVSNHNRNFILVKAFLAVIFCFVIGIILFNPRVRPIKAGAVLITVVLYALCIYWSDNVYCGEIRSDSSSSAYIACLNNNNARLLSGYLDVVRITLYPQVPDSVEPGIVFYTITRGSANSIACNTESSEDYIRVIIQGEDNISFDVIPI